MRVKEMKDLDLLHLHLLPNHIHESSHFSISTPGPGTVHLWPADAGTDWNCLVPSSGPGGDTEIPFLLISDWNRLLINNQIQSPTGSDVRSQPRLHPTHKHLPAAEGGWGRKGCLRRRSASPSPPHRPLPLRLFLQHQYHSPPLPPPLHPSLRSAPASFARCGATLRPHRGRGGRGGGDDGGQAPFPEHSSTVGYEEEQEEQKKEKKER